MRRPLAVVFAAASFLALISPARQGETEANPFRFRRPRWEEPRGEKTIFSGLRVGLDTGAWYADWGIRAVDRGRIYTIHGDPMLWIAPRADLDLPWKATGTLRYEMGVSRDASIRVLSAHASRSILDLGNGSLDLVAGPAYGAIDSAGFPGDFDSALGFDVGAEAATPLGDGWSLRAFGVIRSLHFKYDPSPGVTSFTESQIGTTGFLAGIGLSCKF